MALAESWNLLNPTNASFVDVAPGSTFYTVVETAANYGIVGGYTTNPPCTSGVNCFRPSDNVKRGQMAKMVFLMAQGNFTHNGNYPSAPNWQYNGAALNPRGFLQASIPSSYQYMAQAKSLQWSTDALNWMKDPARNSGVDIVFHTFLANSNSCGSTTYIVAGSYTNNFSFGWAPRLKEACTFGASNQEIRFRVIAPNITAGSSIYAAQVNFYDTVFTEKSEVDVSSYYEGVFDVHKDDMRKFCFYNNVIGFTNINLVCHQ